MPGVLHPVLVATIQKTEWRQSKGKLGRWSKSWRACPVRKDWSSLVLSPWRRLRADLNIGFRYLKRDYKEDGFSVFISSHTENTRGNVCKFHCESFYPDTRKKSLTVRTITETTSPRIWWQLHHCRFSKCNWTGCHIISSELSFPGKVGQGDLSRFFPIRADLWFYKSNFLIFQKTTL